MRRRIVRLQRYRHEHSHLLLDQALELVKLLVRHHIVHENGGLFLEDAVANAGADPEVAAGRRLDHQLVVLDSQENAAFCMNRFDRQIENRWKRLCGREKWIDAVR